MKHTVCIFAVLCVTASLDWTHARSLHYEPELKIIGGNEATPHIRPEVVYLRAKKDGMVGHCGATLLTKRYVLTAAHCVTSNPDKIQVLLGAHNRKTPGTQAKVIEAKNWKYHEKYDEDNDDNDIAIIELAQEVNFTDYIQPVTLPPRSDAGKKYEGRSTKAYGWGDTSDNGNPSDVLKEVSLPILRYSDCKTILNQAGHVLPDNDICTQGSRTRGTCEGDSGGPLFVEEKAQPKNKAIQIGIVSTGFVCGTAVPNIFVQVADYLDWIGENSDINIDKF